MATLCFLITAASLLQSLDALNNGFKLPARGWSSWYAAPKGSQVTESFIRASATALVTSGLAAKGYEYVNVDEGWLKGRHPNGTLYEDFVKFPFGMKALGDWVRTQETAPASGSFLKYGLYSCRGTCQCGTSAYSGPGSHGFEAADVQWMVGAGAQWLKIDSCCGSQDHATAFSDYAKFRDALNATGERVWFNLCGWCPWYAPPDPSLNYTGGASLGNSYRIYGDGGSYSSITGALNTMAAVSQYTVSGGYPDPDNILGPHGTVGRVTEGQARLQMVMWSLAPTQLILGEDVTAMSAQFVETVGNDELLAINHDEPFVRGAARIVGEDLTYPCGGGGGGGGGDVGLLLSVFTRTCETGATPPSQQWWLNTSDGTVRTSAAPDGVLAITGCDVADGTLAGIFAHDSPSGAGCAAWTHDETNHSLVHRASRKCLDEFEWTTPRVDLWTCEEGASNEAWAFIPGGGAEEGAFPLGRLVNNDSGLCLTAAPTPACTNVWARPLANGDVALAMLNNGAGNETIVCDAACFAAAGLGGASRIAVRDLLAHADLPALVPPFALAALVEGDGSAAAFRLTPSA